MKDETLASMGKLLETEMPRDAVHIACAPVIAAQRLAPGEHIGFLPDGRVGRDATAVGIVDAFLKHPVLEGDRFWLFLYPGSITSLKHLWTHPAFEGDAPVDEKARSEKWLRDFCAAADCPGYEMVMAAIKGEALPQPDYVDVPPTAEVGQYLHFNEVSAHGEIPDEFWDHAEIVLGRRLRDKPRQFSCSC